MERYEAAWGSEPNGLYVLDTTEGRQLETNEVVERLNALTAQRDALAAALRDLLSHEVDPTGYMQFTHHEDCGAFDGMRGYTCDCGLMVAVDKVRAALALVDTAGKGEES